MKLTRKHSKSKEEVREALGIIAGDMQKKFGIGHKWDGDTLRFNGNLVSGYIANSGDEITVDLKKSFFLPVPESTLKGWVEEYFDKYLG